MDTVIVLIASPGTSALESVIISKVERLTGAQFFRWLNPQEACELSLKAGGAELEKPIRAELSNLPIDVAVLASPGRRKRLLVADMDSTMIAQECIDEMAIAAGVGQQVSAMTERAMQGEVEFETSLRRRLLLMKGLDGTILDRLVATIRYARGGRTLVQTMKTHGAYTALVSGGFTQFTSQVAGALGFDEHRANELVIEDGRFAGRAREPILGRDAKLATLKMLTKQLGLTPGDSLAIGDGANDVPMLTAAGLGVAFHAKPAVREKASVRVDYGDLTALLYIQGYTRSEFVE
jgi:phosphoserine phosphatase